MSARVVIRREAQPTPGCGGDAARACRPDLDEGPDGTAATIMEDGNGALTLTVRARDISSLRAALNAHLRCLSLAMNVGAGASAGEPTETE